MILDKETARFPWELLNYDEKLEQPIVVSAGMIRQLISQHDRSIIKPVNNNKALIIGDPILNPKAGIPQLPEAAIEAQIVDNLLKESGYNTTAKIKEPFKEIFKKLYDEYKVIHIASHGVIEYGEDKKSGILLSDNVVLTAAEINQISSTPELVFINSCYMGQVNPEKEEHFRKKYQLAANLGVQFIENGVKAVVVAGWEVNDDAAKRFAEVFYEKMLDGVIFAEAVKAARLACFHEFRYTNTWGAYQCYGDQFYTLAYKKRKNKEEEPYILAKEILIDLEALRNSIKSDRKRKYDFRPIIEKISRRIDNSNLRNTRITELEIEIYFDLRRPDIALQKCELLFKDQHAQLSIKILEQWCNQKMKYLQELYKKQKEKKEPADKKTKKDQKAKKDKADQKATDNLKEQIALVENRLHFLINLGATPERRNIMGSFQKSYSMMVEDQGIRKEALEAAAENYKKSFKLDQQIYALTNWLAVEIILNDKARMQDVNEVLGMGPQNYINQELKALAEKGKDDKDFWDYLRPVNLKQVQLVFSLHKASKVNEPKQLVKEIISDYHKAWKKGGGSKKHLLSEISHMEFIKESLRFINSSQKRDSVGESLLDELIDFFKGLDKDVVD